MDVDAQRHKIAQIYDFSFNLLQQNRKKIIFA